MAADPHQSNPASRLHTGDQIGPYLILDTIGSGGMGEVYRARDARLERDVAVKRLSASAIGGDEARARVLREARAAAALTHPNIAAVYDVLETPDSLVIVMEYVPGESVAARLTRGPLPVEEAVRVGLQIADALTEAHDRGVIHRDLKPANVHLTPGGKAKILDFGIVVGNFRPAGASGPDVTDCRTAMHGGAPAIFQQDDLRRRTADLDPGSPSDPNEEKINLKLKKSADLPAGNEYDFDVCLNGKKADSRLIIEP